MQPQHQSGQNLCRQPPWKLGLAVWLATGSWLGLFRFMPGTVGALLGLPLAYGIGHWASVPLQMTLMAGLLLAAVPVCSAAARRLGGKDPSAVILDEIVSLPVVFFLEPVGNPSVLALGFVLHRAFDILKPFPVRQVERMPDGWGIVADDFVAGIYANLGLWLATCLGVFRWLP